MDDQNNPTSTDQPGAPVSGWSPPAPGNQQPNEPAQTPGWTPTTPPAPATPEPEAPAGGPAPTEPTPTPGWTPTTPPAPATPALDPSTPAGGDGTPGTEPVGTV